MIPGLLNRTAQRKGLFQQLLDQSKSKKDSTNEAEFPSMLHLWDWDSKELLLGTMNWHMQHRDCYYTTFCLKIKYNWDKSSGASMYWEFPEKHFYNGYICDCSFFFFLAIQRKQLVTSPKGKALGCKGKDRTCYICSFREGKEQLFKKARHAENI